MENNLIKRCIDGVEVQTRAYSYKKTNRKSLKEYEEELKEERDTSKKATRSNKKTKRKTAPTIETRKV